MSNCYPRDPPSGRLIDVAYRYFATVGVAPADQKHGELLWLAFADERSALEELRFRLP